MTATEKLREKIVFALQEDKTLDLLLGTDVGPITLEIAELAIEHFRTIHSRALACHCECLGMNAENSWRICRNETIAYNDEHYIQTLKNWGLMNEKGEPLI